MSKKNKEILYTESIDEFYKDKVTVKSLRNISFPLIKLNKLVVEDTKNELCLYYGINDINNEKKALDTINSYIKKNNLPKSELFYDFLNRTKIDGKTWEVKYDLNVYSNTECTPEASLILDNTNSFEREFWYMKCK